jgi:hypothetical protein
MENLSRTQVGVEVRLPDHVFTEKSLKSSNNTNRFRQLVFRWKM